MDSSSGGRRFSSGSSVASGSSRFSRNSSCTNGILLSQATTKATLAAKTILQHDGTEEVALMTAKTAARTVLSGDLDGSGPSRSLGLNFLRSRQLNKQIEVVSFIAISNAKLELGRGAPVNSVGLDGDDLDDQVSHLTSDLNDLSFRGHNQAQEIIKDLESDLESSSSSEGPKVLPSCQFGRPRSPRKKVAPMDFLSTDNYCMNQFGPSTYFTSPSDKKSKTKSNRQSNKQSNKEKADKKLEKKAAKQKSNKKTERKQGKKKDKVSEKRGFLGGTKKRNTLPPKMPTPPPLHPHRHMQHLALETGSPYYGQVPSQYRAPVGGMSGSYDRVSVGQGGFGMPGPMPVQGGYAFHSQAGPLMVPPHYQYQDPSMYAAAPRSRVPRSKSLKR